MMFNWVRNNKYAAMIVTLIRLYVGYEWITAGWHKITGGFSAEGFLKGVIANPVTDKATGELVYPTYMAFLEHFALPNVKLINFMIPYGEFLVGLGLLIGALTTAAMLFGLMMNFMFLFAGTVSTNPWLVLLGAVILVAGRNAGKFGADYYLLPYLGKLFKAERGARTVAGGHAGH